MREFIQLSLFLFFSVNVFAQKWALLDRTRKLPVLYTDSITAEQISNGFFPVEKLCVDSFLRTLQGIQVRLEQSAKSKFDNISYNFCSLFFEIDITHHAYGDRYNVLITSGPPGMQTKWRLVQGIEPNRVNAIRVEQFVRYLQKNRDTDVYRFKKGSNKNDVYKKN